MANFDLRQFLLSTSCRCPYGSLDPYFYRRKYLIIPHSKNIFFFSIGGSTKTPQGSSTVALYLNSKQSEPSKVSLSPAIR